MQEKSFSIMISVWLRLKILGSEVIGVLVDQYRGIMTKILYKIFLLYTGVKLILFLVKKDTFFGLIEK